MSTRRGAVSPGPVIGAAIALAAVVAFGVYLFAEGGRPTALDRAVASGFGLPHPGLALDAAHVLNVAGGPIGSTSATVAAAVVCIVIRRFELALAIASTVALATLTETLIKVLVHRPRPADATLGTSTFSYPSGHVTAASALAIAIALAIGRAVAFVIAVGWIVIMAWDRLFLVVHWTTDCLAGAALGASVAIIVATVTARFLPRFGRPGATVVPPAGG